LRCSWSTEEDQKRLEEKAPLFARDGSANGRHHALFPNVIILLLRGLKLPGAEPRMFLCLAACSVAFAVTVAATAVLHLQAVGSSKEVSMDTKMVHRKVVRNSILEAIQGIGTAAIGGVLAT
jgi:hypothetical protein